MKLLIVLAVVVALGAAAPKRKNWLTDWWNNVTDKVRGGKGTLVLDYVHNLRFELHHYDGMHTLLAISDDKDDKACHIIEIDAKTKKAIVENKEAVSEDIYNLIHDHKQTESSVSRIDALKAYHDPKMMRECKNHKLYAMKYSPASVIASVTTKSPVA